MLRAAVCLTLIACSAARPTADPVTPSSNGGGLLSPANALLSKLGKGEFMLMGVGSDDADLAFSFGAPIDLRYRYLVADWRTWNSPDGAYVSVSAKKADSHGAIPMFTLYLMAALGDGNTDIGKDTAAMTAFWSDVRVLYEKLAAFDKPTIVQLEPDFWGYAQRDANDDPHGLVMKVKINPSCSDLDDDIAGMGRCLIRMGRQIAPKAVLGFEASTWSAMNGSKPDGKRTGAFLAAIGGDESDYISVEMLDRDAGCYEARAPECQRNDGPWYWDESGAKSPSFADHLAWVADLTSTLKKPVMWWQIPMGVPSDVPGGSPGAYRDNRVRYIFSHIEALTALGGFAVAFGTGAKNQTSLATDGGQLKNAINAYRALR